MGEIYISFQSNLLAHNSTGFNLYSREQPTVVGHGSTTGAVKSRAVGAIIACGWKPLPRLVSPLCAAANQTNNNMAFTQSSSIYRSSSPSPDISAKVGTRSPKETLRPLFLFYGELNAFLVPSTSPDTPGRGCYSFIIKITNKLHEWSVEGTTR